MHKNQKGFSLLETLIMLIVIAAIAITGWYVYHSGHNTIHKQTKPKSWLTFKSTKSTIEFSYPSSWSIKKIPITGANNLGPSPLEIIELDGPNNFTMEYYLTPRPTGPDIVDCISPTKLTDIPISSQYLLSLRALSSSISISLQSVSQDNLIMHNCVTYNIVTPDIVFSFEGQYQYGSRYANITRQSDYLNLPEVRIAKEIFSSFQM